MALIGEMQYLTIGGNTYTLEDKRIFMITITYDSNTGDYSFDKTFNEIWEAAYSDGKYIIGYAPALYTYYYLTGYEPHYLYFNRISKVSELSSGDVIVRGEGLSLDAYNQVEEFSTQRVVPRKTSDLINDTGYTTVEIVRW